MEFEKVVHGGPRSSQQFLPIYLLGTNSAGEMTKLPLNGAFNGDGDRPSLVTVPVQNRRCLDPSW